MFAKTPPKSERRPLKRSVNVNETNKLTFRISYMYFFRYLKILGGGVQKHFKSYGVLPLILVLFGCAQTGDGIEDALEKSISMRILEVHEKQQNVGVSVAISKNGSIIYDRQIGMADIEHSVKVSDSTRFGVASITKLVTAIAVLELLNMNKLDLDMPIQTYVPTYPQKAEGEITLRMLLTHTSGIPHPSNRTPELFATHFETATDAVAFFADDKLLYAPGSNASYSSTNYNLLAAAIEGITSKGFNDYITKEIFDHLGLMNTSFDNVLRTLKNRTERYSFYHPRTYAESTEPYLIPRWDYSFNPGGGNIISTPYDLVSFAEEIMEPGYLNEKSIKYLYSEELFGSVDSIAGSYIYATGANPGLQAGLAVFPEHKIAVAVLSNTWGLGSRSGEMVQLAKELALLVIKGAANSDRNR